MEQSPRALGKRLGQEFIAGHGENIWRISREEILAKCRELNPFPGDDSRDYTEAWSFREGFYPLVMQAAQDAGCTVLAKCYDNGRPNNLILVGPGQREEINRLCQGYGYQVADQQLDPAMAGWDESQVWKEYTYKDDSGFTQWRG